jgi:hypothetical protein
MTSTTKTREGGKGPGGLIECKERQDGTGGKVGRRRAES